MPEEAQDAVVDSSPTDAPAPSAEVTPVQEPVSQEGTAPSTPTEPAQFNMPPAERWEELRQQRVQAEERAAKAESLAQLALQKLQNPQGQPEVDPYAGMDAPTAEFYRNMDKRIEQKAAQLADQRIAGVLQAVDAGRRELAGMKIAQFRKENPDIKPGSQEEVAIAGYVQNGVDLDSAKKLALYDKLEAENRALKSKHSAVGSKVAANATGPTSSIPAGAGLPGRPGDWRENVREAAKKGGSLADILNAAGATRTP